MATAKMTDDDLVRIVECYLANDRKQAPVMKELGLAQSTVSEHLTEARRRGLLYTPGGAVKAMEAKEAKLPRGGKVKRYLLTCAQDHTKVHSAFWNNLLAMAEHYGAEIMVSTFNYNKHAMGQRRTAKGYDASNDLDDGAKYDPRVAPYINNERIDLAPNITWCGEIQVIPTARRPLSGFENYTYRKSTIVPHTTLALKSVASMKGEGVKLLYTTGACTMRNYIQRKEGFRAEHFHAYAALLVEVDASGRWYCRNVEQGEDGTLRDLNLCFKNGHLGSDVTVVADICWGDIHAAKVDPECAAVSWGGPDSMLDTLKPRTQHVHDLLDMTPRSHHTRKNPFEVYRNYIHADHSSVMTELVTTAKVAVEISRPWCETVVVNANHDRHLDRMLQEVDWRDDPENAEVILDLTKAVLRSIREKDASFYLVEFAMRHVGLDETKHRIRFLREDESDIILPEQDGGIEAGLHGDRGVNGAKGTASGIARMGRKVNMADKHSAERVDLVCVAGTSGLLDAGFNKGPSSWTHSHTVTYPNGCRTIIGVWRGKWRA